MATFDLFYDIEFVEGNLKGIVIKDQKLTYPISSKERVINQCDFAIATRRVSSNSIITSYRIV
jgi:hypothetical protein